MFSCDATLFCCSLKVVVENPARVLDAVRAAEKENAYTGVPRDSVGQGQLELNRATVYKATHQVPPIQLFLDQLVRHGIS